MSVSARLKSILESNHVTYHVISHPPAYTAQAVAAVLHVSGRELAKSVVVRAGEKFALAVLPASRSVDLERLGKILGAKARLASEQEFAELFPDCELGAMPPFGNAYSLPVVVDAALSKDEEIVFNAGTHREAVRMKYADFERIVRPQVAELARAA
jgi:Ala-tRNA(Pro) deacylase